MGARELAFFIGLFGSIHCLGMCGPLAFSIPSRQVNKLYILLDKLLYQIGRVFSYMIIGLVAGLIGKQLWLLGAQQYLSIISGVLILILAISRLRKYKGAKPITFGNGGFNKVYGWLLQKQSGHLLLGMLNGFLPCGFVYLALAGALNTQRVEASVEYMFFFGLGTAPLMLLATVGTGFIGVSVRKKLNSVIPYFMICLGCWFILRAMSLDVPYLSPAIQTGSAICH